MQTRSVRQQYSLSMIRISSCRFGRLALTDPRTFSRVIVLVSGCTPNLMVALSSSGRLNHAARPIWPRGEATTFRTERGGDGAGRVAVVGAAATGATWIELVKIEGTFDRVSVEGIVAGGTSERVCGAGETLAEGFDATES